jgi:hypothetical protein
LESSPVLNRWEGREFAPIQEEEKNQDYKNSNITVNELEP